MSEHSETGQKDVRPSTAVSRTSSATHVQEKEKPASDTAHDALTGGEGESAIPDDKKEEAIENLEDDWTHDPQNPRNWSSGRKWVCPTSPSTNLAVNTDRVILCRVLSR